MTQSFTPRSQPSDADLAYEFLKAQGRPMYYYDLIKEVLSQKNLPLDPVTVSAVLTQINLDTRFAYIGNGEWGLKAWVPARGSRRLPTITLMNKTLAYDDEEEAIDDEDKEVLAEDLDELDEADLDEDSFDSEEIFPEEAVVETEEEPWD